MHPSPPESGERQERLRRTYREMDTLHIKREEVRKKNKIDGGERERERERLGTYTCVQKIITCGKNKVGWRKSSLLCRKMFLNTK